VLREKRIRTRSGIILVYQVEERTIGFLRAESADGKVIDGYKRRSGNKIPTLKIFDIPLSTGDGAFSPEKATSQGS
jgi:hypothetical protein